jgi:transcriptional regulator with XRE-family HTH domain
MGLMADPGGLGQRILQARLHMGARRGRAVTQVEVADAMGVQQGTVGRWEKGIKEPDLETIARLAAVLNVDPRWLAFGDSQESQVPRSRQGETGPSVTPDPAVAHPTPHVPRKLTKAQKMALENAKPRGRSTKSG